MKCYNLIDTDAIIQQKNMYLFMQIPAVEFATDKSKKNSFCKFAYF